MCQMKGYRTLRPSSLYGRILNEVETEEPKDDSSDVMCCEFGHSWHGCCVMVAPVVAVLP